MFLGKLVSQNFRNIRLCPQQPTQKYALNTEKYEFSREKLETYLKVNNEKVIWAKVADKFEVKRKMVKKLLMQHTY